MPESGVGVSNLFVALKILKVSQGLCREMNYRRRAVERESSSNDYETLRSCLLGGRSSASRPQADSYLTKRLTYSVSVVGCDGKPVTTMVYTGPLFLCQTTGVTPRIAAHLSRSRGSLFGSFRVLESVTASKEVGSQNSAGVIEREGMPKLRPQRRH